jgi:DNA mismatch repair protein MutL
MSLQRIHPLPLQLANQIAAGEVVERPASVLKELVENSIDAGSTQIDIHIEGAGRQLIRVSDNGSGIHPDDLSLALSRHATSKLERSEQLNQIASLGFRGEALPSIASVSRLTLASKQVEQNCGWQIKDEHEPIEPCNQANGTTISVEELFFNLPARRHFLRSDKTELHHLITTFHRLALSRFDVGFTAQFSEHQQYRLPALQDAKQALSRIGKICGRPFIQSALHLSQQFDDIHLHGWICPVEAHRAQTDIQYFFINGRVIRDRLINHAIRQAYGDAIPAGRQPAYVLYLTLPMDKVDVNVHPTKHEVRFREARLIHGLITQAVKEALAYTPENETLEFESTPTSKHSVVAEPKPNYQATALHQTARPPQPFQTGSSFTLLHQRFAIIHSQPPKLIDLQWAEREQKQQQFHDAVEQGTLSTRPILVPLNLSATSQQVAQLKQAEAMLSEHGLVLNFEVDTVRFQQIPYLLSQVDLKTLLTVLIDSISADNLTSNTLTKQLAACIQSSPITHHAQAETVIASLNLEALPNAPWCRILDSELLTGLFSG